MLRSKKSAKTLSGLGTHDTTLTLPREITASTMNVACIHIQADLRQPATDNASTHEWPTT